MICPVLRVQHVEDGRGPFRDGLPLQWMRDDPDPALEPFYVERPELVSMMGGSVHWGAGCLTLDGLRRWFDEGEYRRLLELGYHAVRIESTVAVYTTPTQVVFATLAPFTTPGLATPVKLWP